MFNGVVMLARKMAVRFRQGKDAQYGATGNSCVGYTYN